ncbi:transcription termination/antitermination protein NusG [Garciella nitratireducens]|uniref:Transcription termination/antitermination protein NusG n=1 Tax=Garciella nitratireducens DSM 15102 TaxID=1121911 RepID=A0A1T4PU74_9FIRM|nr:transcription termination/antitermination protein NusG [Garciella nitratireducens]SJZ94999.1 transcription antitermination protein nusG [Garciella nitratireducens DSM 15102]
MENENENKAKWYVAHTYSGYENKVKANIEATVENRKMQDIIQEVVVPMQEQVEMKNGKKKLSMKKVFPGYVMIKMIMTDESWYIVRNTRGVTGFVGPGSKPVPLSESELKSMGIQEKKPVLDISTGDSVKVISGPFENFIGVVEDINFDQSKVKVNISMFGRETPVELGFDQIQKM